MHVESANVNVSKSYEEKDPVSLFYHVRQQETYIHKGLITLFCVGHCINPYFSFGFFNVTEAIALTPVK